NAVDALRDEPEPRVVDVSVANGAVCVSDAGEGMSLRAVLSKLLVPFATDKRAGLDIGRFGVGFFSVLGFGLAAPEGLGVHVETGTGFEGWAIDVASQGLEVPDLSCSVSPAAARRGTTVRVTSPLIDSDSVRLYLRDALHFFPTARATLRLDGV